MGQGKWHYQPANPSLATLSGASPCHFPSQKLKSIKRASYKTHQKTQTKNSNYLYINGIMTFPTCIELITPWQDDKTATKLQKHSNTSPPSEFNNINTFFIGIPCHCGILVSSSVSQGRQNNERVRCYRRFYRVFHSGCRLSALAGTALRRLIGQEAACPASW